MKKGFTLIELLVSISIISLLATIVLAALNEARYKAHDAVRTIEARSLTQALNNYKEKFGSYPCQETSYTDYSHLSNPSYLEPLVAEGFLSQVPRDPLGGLYQEYEYSTYNSCRLFYLGVNFHSSDASCPYGAFVPGTSHCHIVYPVIGNCSDPYMLQGEASSWACTP